MKINHNGTDIRVRFEYRHGKNIGHKALNRIKNRRIKTMAIIQQKAADGTWVPISSGVSVRNPKDQFRKSVGRRLALQDAFKHCEIPKEARVALWDQYFDLHRDGHELQVGDLEPIKIQVN